MDGLERLPVSPGNAGRRGGAIRKRAVNYGGLRDALSLQRRAGLGANVPGWLGNGLWAAREGAKKALRCFLLARMCLRLRRFYRGSAPIPATFWKKVDENFKRLRRASRRLS
ncbi:hypothetical protein B5F35_01660 [Anaeromassilibacillus sp. An200]|nr:hypothetical protein B5F35_01660 [Anaeromassilibacillus sp. An200]